MLKILKYRDFSPQAVLLGEPFLKKQQKKLAIRISILFLLILVAAVVVHLCLVSIISAIGIILISPILWQVLYFCDNSKINKELRTKYSSYQIKFLWKFNWKNPELVDLWLKEAVKKVKREKITSRNIKKSINYYKFSQCESTSFLNIKIFIILTTFLLVITTFIANLFRELDEQQMLFILFLNSIIVLANFILILLKQNKEDECSQHKKMQLLCERLLDRIKK